MIAIPVESGSPDTTEELLANTQEHHVPLPVERRPLNAPRGTRLGTLTTSRWRLTVEERSRVYSGEDVFVTLVCEGHPPIALCVGAIPVPDETPVRDGERDPPPPGPPPLPAGLYRARLRAVSDGGMVMVELLSERHRGALVALPPSAIPRLKNVTDEFSVEIDQDCPKVGGM